MRKLEHLQLESFFTQNHGEITNLIGQWSLKYPLWGNETMQIDDNFEGFAL